MQLNLTPSCRVRVRRVDRTVAVSVAVNFNVNVALL
jgi:hypothetical protein